MLVHNIYLLLGHGKHVENLQVEILYAGGNQHTQETIKIEWFLTMIQTGSNSEKDFAHNTADKFVSSLFVWPMHSLHLIFSSFCVWIDILSAFLEQWFSGLS